MAQSEPIKMEKSFGTRTASVLETAALALLLLFALLLCSAAFASTSVIDPDHYESGQIVLRSDSLLYNAMVLVVLAAAARAAPPAAPVAAGGTVSRRTTSARYSRFT